MEKTAESDAHLDCHVTAFFECRTCVRLPHRMSRVPQAVLPPMNTEKYKGGGGGLPLLLLLFAHVGRLTRGDGHPCKERVRPVSCRNEVVGVSPTQPRADRNRWRTREQGCPSQRVFPGRRLLLITPKAAGVFPRGPCTHRGGNTHVHAECDTASRSRT